MPKPRPEAYLRKFMTHHHLLPSRADVQRGHLPKGIARLPIHKVHTLRAEGVADVIVERIAVKIAVNARYGNHERVGMACSKKHTVKQYAPSCFYFQVLHNGCKSTQSPRQLQCR